jgi:hypothetical protein
VVLNDRRAKLPLLLTPLTYIHVGDDEWRFFSRNPLHPKKGAGAIFAPSVVGIRLFGMTKPRSFRLAGGKNDLQQW